MRSAPPRKSRLLTVSLDATTESILEEEARVRFDGDVSKLIAVMAREARHKAALGGEGGRDGE